MGEKTRDLQVFHGHHETKAFDIFAGLSQSAHTGIYSQVYLYVPTMFFPEIIHGTGMSQIHGSLYQAVP